jgi:SAM-dependent methyltransferase
MCASAMKGFPKKYSEAAGVERYYESCLRYSNPHSSKFKEIIRRLLDWLPLDLKITPQTPILDLACGSGQVTKALLENGIDDIIGMDPYLSDQYLRETNKVVYQNSFDDLISGVLILPKTSLVICSYALHLCLHRLDDLLLVLQQSSSYLCIISPHGLPIINEETSGWRQLFTFKYSNIKTSLYCCRPPPLLEESCDVASTSADGSPGTSIESDLVTLFSV